MKAASIRYSPFIRAIVLIAASVWYAPMLRAQDCSRNMLTITNSSSYVATPGISALNLTKGFTIECWAKVSSVAPGAALVDKADYGIFFNNDSVLYGMVHHAAPLQDYTPSVDSFPNWHHFAFTFTPGDSLRFYVDTIEVSSEAAPFASIDSNTDSVRIGMSWTGVGFTGSIDELRIWNTPRSLANIRQTMYQGVNGSDPGLALYYSFDDDIGSRRIHDFSNHGRDGFMRGANAEIAPSSSPMLNGSPGYALSTVEKNIIIPTLRCASAFDTVIHVRNLGSTPLIVDTVAFRLGVAFSIVPNTSFTLPADSNIIDSLRLHFEPDEGGVFDDSLYIASPSICGGRLVIGLQGAYDSVGLRSSPDSLNFGNLTQCQLPVTREITLTNTSVTDSVTILSSLPPSDSGIQVLASFPIHLAPHQDTAIAVELLAGVRGTVTSSLHFSLNKCSRVGIVTVTAVRQEAELSMPATVDFGSTASVIGGVTRDTTIVVTNTGDVPNEISLIGSSDTTILKILDGRTGILKAPGDTLQVRVRFHDTVCGSVTELLKLKSYFCSVDTTTTLSISLTPPMPLTAPTLDMGVSCVRRDTTIYVSNPNDIPVTLDTVAFSKDSIFQNFPFFPITVPAHGIVPVQFSFNPANNIVFVDTAFLQMSPCGTGTVIFKGQLGFQGISFSGPQLLFGRGCKTDSISELDTLTNRTPDTIELGTNTYTGSLRFSISPFSFPVIVPPGASKAIWVTYSPVLGALDTGTFAFLTFDGCTAASFHLRGSREIAKAAWASLSGTFDTICPGASQNKTFTLKDKGIDSIDEMNATVTGAGFTLLQSPSAIGDSGHFQIEFTPDSLEDYSGLLTVVVDSCGTSFSLPLHGTGGPEPEIAVSDTMHDFDSILAGDSVTYCFTITNPSCQPINLHLDTSGFAGTAFKIIQMPNSALIASGDTAYLCVEFSPETFGNSAASIAIVGDSIPSKFLSFQGVGLAPDVTFRQHILDFGYVLFNTSKTMVINDSNIGNRTTTIAVFNDSPVFVVQPPSALAPLKGDSIPVSFNPVPGTGLVYDTLRFLWDGHSDSVILRGIGTEKGLQTSAVGLDFGNVHIGNDSALPLYLFATNNFPTIDSITIRYVTPIPHDSFFVNSSDTLSYTLKNAQDTLALYVTYRARLEQLDTDYLVIHSGGNSTMVFLSGRGVESLPWISPASIGFLPTTLNTPTRFWSVQIGNAGSYPLYIDSIFSTNPVFAASSISSSEPIQPGDTLFDTVTFTPTRTRAVTATLGFVTSYRDSMLTVLVSGSGTYSPTTGPDFGYTIQNRVEEPGKNDSIPVTINGKRLAQILDDSATLDIHFDPQMVMMLGADGGTTTNAVSRFILLDDSTVEVVIPRNNFADGDTLMRLYTQALLGPHDTSYIHVIPYASEPLADDSSIDGEFIVEDCGGPVQGVVFAGPYSTSAIVPNPAGDNATLTFEIGWDAPVTLDFYNAVGQNIKHIDVGTLTTGVHTLTLDVSGLPQGRYVYRLTSLDYHAEGALVIVR